MSYSILGSVYKYDTYNPSCNSIGGERSFYIPEIEVYQVKFENVYEINWI